MYRVKFGVNCGRRRRLRATTIAACFADLGHEVTVVDPDGDAVEAINVGTAPVDEDGLDDLVAEHAGEGGRLGATTGYDAVRDADVTFLYLPTPQNRDGSIDLSAVEAGAERVGRLLGEGEGWHTVVVQSTVVPGSTEDVVTAVLENESGRVAGEDIGVGMTPEFLGEGTAVHDFIHPDMVVLGADHDRTLEDLRAVFDPLVQRADPPVVDTDARTAEMIKYAHNSYLAVKVSLSNDVGNVCKEFDVDAYEVADAIGLDDRIGSKILRSGLGYDFTEEPVALAESLLDQSITSMKIWPFDRFTEKTRGQRISTADLEAGLEPIRLIRDAVGDRMDVAVEFHGRWSVTAGKRLVNAVAEYDPLWVEDVVRKGDYGAYRRLAESTDVPLCISERLVGRYEFKQALETGAVDVVMPDLCWTGGITEGRAIASMAEAHHLPVAPHNSGGPVLHRANAHLSATIPNLYVMEAIRDRYDGWHRNLVTDPLSVTDGSLEIPEGPGLGTRLDEPLLDHPETTVRETAL